MPEDPADDRRLLDERNQTQAATTPGARQHVTPEGAGHQRRPAPAAGLTPRRLRGLRRTGGRGGRLAMRPHHAPTSSGAEPPPPAKPRARPGPRSAQASSASRLRQPVPLRPLASPSWTRCRLIRGRGTKTASRPRSSTGSNTSAVVPSRHGGAAVPAAPGRHPVSWSRSCATGGRSA